MSSHDATFYVQVEPEFYTWAGTGDVLPKLSNIKAVRLSRERPRAQKPGTVLVKLTLRVPDAAFYPLRPEAIVVVPESMTSAVPLTVEVTDARESGEVPQ